MKKIILTLTVILVLLFGGCSCNSAASLSFGNEWNNNQSARVGMSETTTYGVTFSDNFSSGSYSYKKNSSLDGISYEFTGGTFVMAVSVLNSQATIPNAESSIVSEIREASTQPIIRIRTELRITSKYNCGDKPAGEFDSYDDFAISETYVSGNSLVPIYSCSESNFSHLLKSNGKYTVQTSHTKSEFLYEKNSFVLKTETLDPVPEKDEDKLKTSTVNYTYKSAIDNAELLFALRSYTIKKDATVNLPVISATYGKAETLNVKYYDDQDFSFNASVNETNVETTVTAKCLSFVKAPSSAGCTGCLGGTTTGSPQLVFLQNAANEQLSENRALMVRYVSPLTAIDGTYSCMGALVYNLENVTITGV